MTVFDVLRYPISSPPTVEELEALPEDLYYEWISTSVWRGYPLRNDRAHIAIWYINSYVSETRRYKFGCDEEDLDALRGIIRRYGS
jgi:hypothetical protein